MADIDIDPFGEHESRPEEPTDENIALDPVTPEGPCSAEEDQLGNQNVNRKHYLEVQVVQVCFTKDIYLEKYMN